MPASQAAASLGIVYWEADAACTLGWLWKCWLTCARPPRSPRAPAGSHATFRGGGSAPGLEEQIGHDRRANQGKRLLTGRVPFAAFRL
jgi:hypothetical protein